MKPSDGALEKEKDIVNQWLVEGRRMVGTIGVVARDKTKPSAPKILSW
jgi:hypothetical protein